MHAQTKTLLSVDEVAEATSLGRTTIFALMKRGDLRAIKVGKRTFVRPSDLKEFVDNCPARSDFAG